ncbi:transmembrane protein 171 isoform X2 [Castor canadensis]|uniref:Transmembrane protein 171 isoform X2 n=1 Tax=Castor canadensis TaxID=51338 RepID=A0A8B7V363_CASCN
MTRFLDLSCLLAPTFSELLETPSSKHRLQVKPTSCTEHFALQGWWLTPVPATQEAEIGRIKGQGQPRQEVIKTSSQPTSWGWWHTCNTATEEAESSETLRGKETHPPSPQARKGTFLVMSSIATAEPDEDRRDRHVSKLIFFLFVFGAVLLCVGVLLSIFGYQSGRYKPLPDCSLVLKVAGPSCAVVGLGAVILARSRARLQLRERQQRGSSHTDSDQDFVCGESRQFAQCLIFGFLFLTSGMLISILGIWVPGCSSDWAQELLNETDTIDPEPQICGFLSLQIMGPLIVLVGLCFFVVAHVKKKNNLSAHHEATEEGHTHSMEPVQVTVGDSVIVFPPPPPPYFAESSAPAGTRSPGANSSLPSESPPSYYSLYSYGTPTPEGQDATSEREREFIYTISGTNAPSEISHPPHPTLDLPPRYEEKENVTATSLAPSSEPSPP